MLKFVNKNQHKLLKILICNALVFSCSAIAADTEEGRIEIASSFNPVGSGARALGMGGAFISIADDATAASWNPGALIQLRTAEISFVGGGFKRTEESEFGVNTEASGSEAITNTNLNYLSASYPCGADLCGKNMVFSINYQNLYNFDKKWEFPIHDNAGSSISRTNYDFSQTGDLSALGLAYAIQATDTLSLGFTLNLWGDFLGSNQWEQRYNINREETLNFTAGSTSAIINQIYKENYEFSGINANLGLFWNFYQQEEQKLTLGVVFKSPFTADIKHTKNLDQIRTNDGGIPIIRHSYSQVDEKMDMPMSFGIGLAYQFSDALTFAGDIYRTNWNDFIRTDANGNKSSVISNVAENMSDVDATYQLRLGTEYRIISQEFGSNYIIPLRAGLFYDPTPAEGSPDKYYGFSLGTGIAYKTYVFDIAYQYRFGNNVGSDLGAAVVPGQDFSQDVKEHTLYASLAVRF